jgi:hypothetical protein
MKTQYYTYARNLSYLLWGVAVFVGFFYNPQNMLQLTKIQTGIFTLGLIAAVVSKFYKPKDSNELPNDFLHKLTYLQVPKFISIFLYLVAIGYTCYVLFK